MSKREKIGMVSWMFVMVFCLIFMMAYDKCPSKESLCQQACEEKYKEYDKTKCEMVGIDKGSTKTHLHCDCYIKCKGKE